MRNNFVKGLFILMAISFIMLILPSKMRAQQSERGTLMGNPEGTAFCCASGTNSCSAAKCGNDNP